MLGGGCQVRVVIENMMGRMENLRILISGFLGLVILVRWALVTIFLSWTTQTGCRIHRTYVSLIGSGEGRHTTHLLNVFCYSQLRRLPGSNLLTFFLTYFLTFFLTYHFTFFLTYLLTFFLTSFWHIFWHSFWQIVWHSFWHIFWQFSDISFDMLSDISSDILSDISKPKPNIHSFTKKPLCKLYIYLTPRSKSTIHNNFVPVNVIALSASDRPAKGS